MPTPLQIVNTKRPDFFPENIRKCLDARKELEAVRKNKYVEITNDFYNLITSPNIAVKSKYPASMQALTLSV